MNVLILGGSGYVGSRLIQHLSNKHTVRSIDLCWFGNPDNVSLKLDYNDLTSNSFEKYDAVVLLAGHSSVKMCVNDYYSSFNNNVANFISLANKLNQCKKSPKLIYASSSSVYGFTNGKIVDETFSGYQTTNNYDLSKYALDLYMQNGQINGSPILNEWYSLRFGTVNGWSPNLRGELMINSMMLSASKRKFVEVSNSHINRAILGIRDLCNSVELIITNGTPANSGIYNLSSFNDSVKNIAATVSSATGVDIVDRGQVGISYDFMISNNKFANTFGYTFVDDTYSIVNDLLSHSDLNVTNRDHGVLYGKF